VSLWSAEGSGWVVAVREMYVTAAGGLVEGVLLSQIAFWFRPNKSGKTKLSVTIEGRKWLAKTGEELCGECGLTMDQYKRCIKVLRDRGIIETRLKKFMGKTVTHFWLDEKRVLELGSSDGVKTASKLVDDASSQLSKSLQSGGVDFPPAFTEITQETTNQNTFMSLSDEEKCQSEQFTGSVLNDLESNVKRWNCQLKAIWNMSKGLTAKERTTLLQIMKVAKENTPALIDAAICDWASYRAYVMKTLGWSFFPKVPVIKSLLGHVDLALQHYGFVQNYQDVQEGIQMAMKSKVMYSTEMPKMDDPVD
jgi:hypothetical protein